MARQYVLRKVWQPPARPPTRTGTTIPLVPEGLRGRYENSYSGKTPFYIDTAPLIVKPPDLQNIRIEGHSWDSTMKRSAWNKIIMAPFK